MKTLKLRVCYLGLALTSIVLAPGAEEVIKAEAELTDPVADVLPPLLLADVDANPAPDLPAPLAAPPDAGTNAPAKKPVMVQAPAPPENLKLSPGLAEVVKLVQAGVSEDVLMAYVTNSTEIFAINSDAIVYLNDLGLANNVITALIQHDSSPATAARRASANAVQPLPPGVATSKPVQDVYPPAANRTFPAAGQTTYPGDFATLTDTNPPASELQPAVEATAPATEAVTVNNFYSSLAPYGTWMDVEGYGRCWQPTVAVGNPYWRPYSDRGRWLWSDCGWYWYSDYSWGWAPFHYGRWCTYPSVGWLWVPGSVWAPSWVTWRHWGSYCGWAPLPPGCGYNWGVGLTWYGSGVGVGFGWGLGWNCYTYVPIHRFCDWNVRRHCLPDNELHVVHRNAVQVNNFSAQRGGAIVNNGIEANTIARASRTKIPTMRVRDGGPLPVNGTRPERIENNGREVAIVRPQLPTTPSPSRGTATRGQAINLANPTTRTADASAARPQATSPLASANTPRANVNRPAPSPLHPPQSETPAPSTGTATRHGNAALAPQTATPNRPAAAQPSRPQTQPQSAPNAASRTVTPPPAQRNSAPMARNSTPAPAPSQRNTAPPPARTEPAARPNAAPQAAPRGNPGGSGNIRSFSQPQVRSVPQQARPNYSPLHPPQSAPRAMPSSPMAAGRPQVSAPASRPSVSPPAARSAPSSGTGGARSTPSSGGNGRGSGTGLGRN